MENAVYCPNCARECEYNVTEKNESYEVKGENIGITAQVAHCRNCGEEVFQEGLDSQNLNRAYQEYRNRHGLLSPEEIREIRERYGLSQRAFSRLLNWGEITVHRYEAGAIQDQSHNDLLVLLKDPENMRTLLAQDRSKLTPQEVHKLEEKLTALLPGTRDVASCVKQAMSPGEADIYSGFRQLDLNRLYNAVLFFTTQEKGLLKTKLLKELWYSDFFNFKLRGVSLTGVRYVHYPFGPVPEEFNFLLGSMALEGLVDIVPVEVHAYMGEEIQAKRPFEADLFLPEELEVLKKVFGHFQGCTSKDISERSHAERAYKETKDRERISYEWAQYLSI